MVSREETDLKQAEKYAGRYIIGKDLMFPNRFGADITSSGSIEFRDETPEMKMFVKITPITDKTTPEDVYGMDSGRMQMQPTAVYLDLETAKILQKKLNDLCRLHPSVVGEVSLYDTDENDSLLTACVLSKDVPRKKLVNIKLKILETGKPYHALILSYDWNIDGKWISIDWNPGLKYKDRLSQST